MHRYWKPRGGWRAASAALVAAVVATLAVGTGSASAAGVAHDGVVGELPSDRTPYIMNNKVLDLAQIGNRIIVAGSFTSVREAPANGGGTVDQPYVLAFDATTGAIDRAFDPRPNGRVNVVLPGPDGTVYLGGTFASVDGATGSRNLAQVSLATGDRVTPFRTPALNGAVNDLVLSGGRLYVGGVFNSVAGVAHGGLATLDPATGALDEYMGVDVAVNHNYPDKGSARASVGVTAFDITPDGSRLVAVGNFRLADGLPRDQVALLRLDAGGAVVDPDWRTRRYEPACYSWAFDTYMRDVQIAPDGSFFSVATTGGANPGTLCDSITRWEIGDTGDDVQPRWAEFSGGDTLFSVEITGSAVYAGGHQRWMNNPYGRDFPGAGAVPRPGISAHDPRTGVPLSWNPGRHPRGVGAEALLATADGLYVGMDTKYIGNFEHWRPGLAAFALADGTALPAEDTGALPGNVFLGGRQAPVAGGGETGEVLHRVNAGGGELAALDGGPAWTADDGATNPLRNSGSNAAGWSGVPATDGSVPASTPSAVFDSERWDPDGDPEMTWALPVAEGTTVDVRLYLANRCGCTAGAGQRAFDVTVEGSTVLDDYDIVGDVGHDVGTMKSFTVTSDGTIDIAFGHVVENPLVNGIEIVESTGAAPAGPIGVDDVVARYFDGDTAGPDTAVGGGGLEWSRVRGAFMAGGDLVYGYPTAGGSYSLFRRSFDGSAFGEAEELLPYFDPEWSDVQTGSGQTYRGALPPFWSQLSSVGSMFLDGGRLYYTRTGAAGLYSRGFSVDSGIVGAEQTTAVSSGFGNVSGAFVAGDRLYWAVRSTGELRSAPWNGGSPDLGAATTEAGPSVDGRSWSTRALFVGPGDPPPAPNQPPTASFTADCAGLSCTFDGSGSSDADGSIATWAWDFGDGTTSTEQNPRHAYDAAGDYEVGLTVTDDSGASSSSSQTVSVASPPAASGIDLRGAAGVSDRGVTSVSVDVPADVQAGDGMLLVLSTNSPVTGTAPAGWVQEEIAGAGTSVTSQLFSRVAAAGDAGGTVTVALSGRAKVTLQLLAYAGTAADPTASVASAADVGGTAHTTPSASAPAGSWVVSVWSDKQAAAREFTAPSGVVVRGNLAGVGSGDVATLVADSGTAVTGGVGGLTATVPTASNRATMFTVVLAPAGDTGGAPPPPANAEPAAAFSSSCSALSCSFDGTGSTDEDGTVVDWAWTFGDGGTGTGATPEHAYGAAGDYEVTLTVTDDDGATSTSTATVPVAAAPPADGIGLRGSAGSADRMVTAASLTVPEAVVAGDAMVLVLSTNSSVTGAAPAGWTQAGQVSSGNSPTTQVFERVAEAGDAGSELTVALSGQAKVTLQLLAYSGTDAADPVASVTTAAAGSGTEHTTPAATAAAGSWVLSVWSDKQADARQWTPPAEATERSNVAGIGSGDIATLVADSGGPVTGGAVGGLTASVPTPSNRATMFTIVLAPAR